MKYIQALHYARSLRKNQTFEERILWKQLRKRQIGGFRFNRQFIIKHQNEKGNIGFFIVDFYCHQKRLIIEVDGPIHQAQIEYDRWREEVLFKQEFKIIRFTNDQIKNNLDYVLLKIRATLNPTLSFG